MGNLFNRRRLWVLAILLGSACATKKASEVSLDTHAKPSPGPVTSKPAKVDFGKVRVKMQSTRWVLIKNESEQDVELALGLMGDSGSFIVRDEDCRLLLAHNDCKVQITYRPTALGQHSATLRTWGIKTAIDTQLTGQSYK